MTKNEKSKSMELPKSDSELEEMQLRKQYQLIWGLLIFVTVSINVPIFSEQIFARKPSESILNNQNQSALLITGALCNALGMLFGFNQAMSDVRNRRSNDTNSSDNPIDNHGTDDSKL